MSIYSLKKSKRTNGFLCAGLAFGALSNPLTAIAKTIPVPDSEIEKVKVYGVSFAEEGALEVSKRDLEQTMATTADELFRNVANLEAIQGPGRQFFDLNLRGSEGAGSVIVTVDGAEKNLVTTKHGSTFNPVFLVPEFLKTVTVIRGPVSNTFGTGSTGGRVQLETIDPFDYVDGDDQFGGELRANAENNGDGRLLSGVAATNISDDFAILGAVSKREFNSYEDGDGREVLNSGSESTNFLGKAQWSLDSGFDIEATHADSKIEYVGSNVFGRNNNRQDADYANDVRDKNTSIAVDYGNEKGFEWSTNVFLSTTEHSETLVEARSGTNSEIGSTDVRDIETKGIQSYISQKITLGEIEMDVSTGLSGSKNTLDFVGDSEDVGGQSENYGVFVQGFIKLNEKLSLIPGIRYERFDLNTEDGQSSSGSEWTPKLTVNYDIINGVRFYATAARGIRAPLLNDLVLGSTTERTRGRNTTIITQLPTDDLTYETADTIDFGIRLNTKLGENSRIVGSIGMFENDVKNRIESVVLSRETSGNVTMLTNQIQNVGSASIQGLEANLEYQYAAFAFGLTYANTDGEREDTGEELNSVRPEQGSAYITWTGLDQKLVIRGEVESFGSKTELGDGGVVGDSSDSATIGNIYFAYGVNNNTVIKARVNNITDKAYRRFDQIDNAIGRNVRIELLYRF